MAWTKMWICAGILVVGMTTCTIRAEVVDMGGFQIQIGQKPGGGIESAGQDTQKNGQTQKQEKVTEAPRESSGGIFYEEPYTEPVQELYTESSPMSSPMEQEEAVQEEVQELAGQSGQEAEGFFLETGSMEQDDLWTETETGADGNAFSGEGGSQEPGAQMQEDTAVQPQESTDLGYRGAESEKIRKDNGGKKEIETGESKTGSEVQEIQFLHDDVVRIKPGAAPSVRLKGQQEACVISYAVNRRECACRWEGDRLIPVEPVFRKGMNCLEISVFSEDGQVISMKPWYFSCGVGAAML